MQHREYRSRDHYRRDDHGRSSAKHGRSGRSRGGVPWTPTQKIFLWSTLLFLVYQVIQAISLTDPHAYSELLSRVDPSRYQAYFSSGAGSEGPDTPRKYSGIIEAQNFQEGSNSMETSDRVPKYIWSWFEQAAMSVSQSIQDTSLAASTALHEAAVYASNIRLVDGIVSLPALQVDSNGTSDTSDSELQDDSQPSGAVWNSASWTAISGLPAYLKAVAMHAAPDWTKEEALEVKEERGSIFVGRRKGEWMGCSKPYYMICKGVYRAIKRVNAMTVLDTACAENAHWLPLVLIHLKKEFRRVDLTCASIEPPKVRDLMISYEGIDNVKFMRLDPFAERIENQTDLMIAVQLLERRSTIHAMRLFKNVQNNPVISHIVFENYPESRNRRNLNTESKGVKLNVFAPPFMFGRPIFQYGNPDERPTREAVSIITMQRDSLFQNQQTPTMSDLEDPKLRKRRVEPE